MELLKNPYIAAAVVVVCIIVFYAGSTGDFFGKFFNRFFPCTQNPAQSAPCYMGVDITIMIIAAIIGIVFAVILVLDLYKMFEG